MSPEPIHPDDPRVVLAHDRTDMAAYRTALALERTTLSWLRTTLTMASFGFAMAAHFRGQEAQLTGHPRTRNLYEGAISIGAALVLLGIAATILAGVGHWLALQRLRRDQAPVLSRWPLSLTLAVFSSLIGLAGLWALFGR